MGRLEVVCGPMFSGKSEELIRRIKRAKIARMEVATFKSCLDERYHQEHIVSHDQRSEESKPIASLNELQDITPNFIAVDEIQFFPPEEIQILQKLANAGKVVIAAGLDMDFKGEPFAATALALALADEAIKLKAICTVCGEEAGFSKRLSSEKAQIVVGEKNVYEARCRKHFT